MQEAKFFPLQWVSHSLFRLAELPYAKEFYHHNALCKIDCRVAGWGGKKKKKKRKKDGTLYQLREFKMEESCARVVTGWELFKWGKSADASRLPCGNGFVCGPKHPLLSVSEEYRGGLCCIHFLLPWPFILIREWSPPLSHTWNNWHCVLWGHKKYTPSTYPHRCSGSEWKDCSWALS